MEDLLYFLVPLVLLGLFLFSIVWLVIKFFSWLNKKKNLPTPRSPVQASLLELEQKAKKQTKSSAPTSISPSSKSKNSSKKSPDSPKKGFSSLQEEQEFQTLLLAKANEVGKLEAVKFVTQTKGWGLKESKDYCDRVFAAAPLTDKKTTPTSLAPISADALAQVTLEKMLRDGKFEAVKELMVQTGWNLKTAKTFCDTLEEEAKKSGKKAPEKPSVSQKASASSSPSPGKESSFDLEHEVKQLMERTGWDYATAKSYCQSSLDYHKKVSAGATLKK
jgi:ribosomal protein L7/L12